MNRILSVFEDTRDVKKYPSLSADISVDVAIIGGGITGLTAAYLLSRQGKSVVVIEAHSIGKGSTGNSTGNLYATVGNKGLHAIKSKFDKETMAEVVLARAAAVDFIEQRVSEFGIDCDFKRVSWNLFSEDDKSNSFIKDEREALEESGLATSDDIQFPLHIEKGVKIDRQAQFNPYRYVIGLAENIVSDSCQIYENTKVKNVEDNDGIITVETENYKVTARHAIMATHTPKGIYLVQTLLGPYREYAVAVKLNGEYPPDGTFWDMQESEHYSMRTVESAKGKVLLALGESHKVGQKEDNTECFEKLEKFLRERFLVTSVEYKWAAQQYKPADTLPYIGSTDDSNIYIATGFSADGLTYGTMASMILADTISGRDNKWAKIFDAKRHTPIASSKEFLKENLNVAAQFLTDIPFKGDVKEFSEIGNDEGKVIYAEGEKFGAYRDDSGILHVVSAVCPHMRCIVNWNKSEKSWDCPCHGSRFDIAGKVIEGPAYGDLRPYPITKNERE